MILKAEDTQLVLFVPQGAPWLRRAVAVLVNKMTNKPCAQFEVAVVKGRQLNGGKLPPEHEGVNLHQVIWWRAFQRGWIPDDPTPMVRKGEQR